MNRMGVFKEEIEKIMKDNPKMRKKCRNKIYSDVCTKRIYQKLIKESKKHG